MQLELNNKEVNELINILDAATRSMGLKYARACDNIFIKIQEAFQKENLIKEGVAHESKAGIGSTVQSIKEKIVNS